MSLLVSLDREEAEVKRGRPLGPTLRDGFFSSALRLRRRSCSSKKTSAVAAVEEAGVLEVGVGFDGDFEEKFRDEIVGVKLLRHEW
jgi:hypothetical protein